MHYQYNIFLDDPSFHILVKRLVGMFRIGVIGCGEIAQIMHIPYFNSLAETQVTAIADPARDRLRGVGDKYNIPHRFESGNALLDARGDALDAVLVLTPADCHADISIQALEAGLHTFVEKPIAVSLADAERMVAAAEKADATAMVGYMKRYDPSYRRYKRAVSDLDQIDLVTAYSVDPDHRVINDEVYDIIGGSVPERINERSRNNQLTDGKALLDTTDDELVQDFLFHLKHACHDINALRGLFGAVTSIDHAQRYADGRYVTAHLRYDDHIHCTLHSGLSERKWFEETIRVDYPTGMVRLDFDNPYIKNAPTEFYQKHGQTELTTSKEVPSYAESFEIEAKQFIDAIASGETPRTTFAEAQADLKLIANIIRTAVGKSPVQS
jgi:predicted dehydrogenase